MAVVQNHGILRLMRDIVYVRTASESMMKENNCIIDCIIVVLRWVRLEYITGLGSDNTEFQSALSLSRLGGSCAIIVQAGIQDTGQRLY